MVHTIKIMIPIMICDMDVSAMSYSSCTLQKMDTGEETISPSIAEYVPEA